MDKRENTIVEKLKEIIKILGWFRYYVFNDVGRIYYQYISSLIASFF